MADRFRITFADGRDPVEVAPVPFDHLAYEKARKRGFIAAVTAGEIEPLYWVAWHAYKRRHPDAPAFEVFLEGVESCERVVDDEEPPDPTGGAEGASSA